MCPSPNIAERLWLDFFSTLILWLSRCKYLFGHYTQINKSLGRKIVKAFSYPSVKKKFGTQKNGLIKTVLLSTHNIILCAWPPDKKKWDVNFFLSISLKNYGTQKNCLIETVLLSTHNILLCAWHPDKHKFGV